MSFHLQLQLSAAGLKICRSPQKVRGSILVAKLNVERKFVSIVRGWEGKQLGGVQWRPHFSVFTMYFSALQNLLSGYVHTGPVPNGSDPKIVPDRPFVHTGPANRTVNPFPIRSENWTS